jgi:hypothetical protein
MIALLVVLALVSIVWGVGEFLLDTAMGSVCLNIFSDIIFVVIGATLFGLLYHKAIIRATKFFGIKRQTPIQVYISAHRDPATITRKVLTAEESEVAEELKDALKKQFPDSIAFWAKQFGIELETPEIVIKGSPLDKINTWPYPGGLVLIGGPTRNSLAEFYLKTGNPWLSFDDDKKRFVRRTEQGQCEKLDNSHKLAILEKMVIDGKAVIVAFGFGELGTSSAVRHLINEWKILADKYQDKAFARLLLVESNGQVHVQEEYTTKTA